MRGLMMQQFTKFQHNLNHQARMTEL